MQKKQNEPNLLDFQFKNGIAPKMYSCIPVYLHTCIPVYLFHQNEPNFAIFQQISGVIKHVFLYSCIPVYLYTCIPAYLFSQNEPNLRFTIYDLQLE